MAAFLEGLGSRAAMALLIPSCKEEQAMFFSGRILRVASLFLSALCLFGAPAWSAEETPEPRGEIRVVESWRPDINVLGHNVLQYLAPKYMASVGWEEFLKQREVRMGKEVVAA